MREGGKSLKPEVGQRADKHTLQAWQVHVFRFGFQQVRKSSVSVSKTTTLTTHIHAHIRIQKKCDSVNVDSPLSVSVFFLFSASLTLHSRTRIQLVWAQGLCSYGAKRFLIMATRLKWKVTSAKQGDSRK